jgi:hypothetical protein
VPPPVVPFIEPSLVISDLETRPLLPSPNSPSTFGGHVFSLPISPFIVPEARALTFESIFGSSGSSLGRDHSLERSIHYLPNDFGNVLTQLGPNSFQIVVNRANDASLKLFRGVPDQELTSTRTISVQVPVDAFVHTQEEAIVELSARMIDGTALPSWLVFDAITGKFTGLVPDGAPQVLEIVVEARDRDGRRAEALFRIKVASGVISGRASLSEQIRMAAKRSDSLDQLRQLQTRPVKLHNLPAR